MQHPLLETIQRWGLPHWYESYSRLAKPSIRITSHLTNEDDLPLGVSKFGGIPDLPQSYVWPRNQGTPLTFVAQFCLSDITTQAVDCVLPDDGTLYFFYDIIETPGGYEPADRGSWRVLYTHPTAYLIRQSPPDDIVNADPYDPRQLPCCGLTFTLEETLPDWSDSLVYQRLGYESPEHYQEVLIQFSEIPGVDFPPPEVIHRLLGHPDIVQGPDMRATCNLALHGVSILEARQGEETQIQRLLETSKDWYLLLQLDSDEANAGMLWGDNGRIYYWIRQQDLATRNFDDVWLVLQGH